MGLTNSVTTGQAHIIISCFISRGIPRMNHLFLTFSLLSIYLMSFYPSNAGADWFLSQTGQTSCYDSTGTLLGSCAGTGNDGAVLAGQAWPTPRFTVNKNADGVTANGTVTDNLTGLVWLKNANCYGKQAWTGALVSAQALANGTCGLADGSSSGQWRIPNVAELNSLLNAQEASSATWLNTLGFDNAQNDYYWTSTTNAGSAPVAWRIIMGAGVISGNDKGLSNVVWPVRNGTAAGAVSLPKTGQTISSTVTDDGDLETGLGWPSPRFTVNAAAPDSSNTVTDNLTKLIWFKSAFNSFQNNLKSWQDALSYIQTLNASNRWGHTDWRLPNRTELMSLVNWGQSASYSWLVSQGFTTVKNDFGYWTGTSYGLFNEFAWSVNFGTAAVLGEDKISSRYIWPVCGGQYWSLELLKSGLGGTVTSMPAGIDCGETCTTRFLAGTSVILTATPDVGMAVSWSGCDSTSGNQCTVAMDSSKSVAVSFGSAQYSLYVSVSGSGSGSVTSSPPGIACPDTCQANFDPGTPVVLTAFPAAASAFDGWSVGACSGTGDCSVDMNASASVGAAFSLVPLAKNNDTGIAYATFVEALSQSAAGAEILLLDSQHDGVVNLDKNIILSGGWNLSFLAKSGLPSTLGSGLTVFSGDINAETLIVKGKIEVQGGSLRTRDVMVQ